MSIPPPHTHTHLPPVASEVFVNKEDKKVNFQMCCKKEGEINYVITQTGLFSYFCLFGSRRETVRNNTSGTADWFFKIDN